MRQQEDTVRRYWVVELEERRWVVVAESVHDPCQAVVVADHLKTYTDAREYMGAVNQRQWVVGGVL